MLRRIDIIASDVLAKGSCLFHLRFEEMLSVYMVPDTGGKGEKYMKSKIKYTDEPIGKTESCKRFSATARSVGA